MYSLLFAFAQLFLAMAKLKQACLYSFGLRKRFIVSFKRKERKEGIESIESKESKESVGLN